MNTKEEIKFLLKNISTLDAKTELIAESNITNDLIEHMTRLNTLNRCLILACWKIFGDREVDSKDYLE